MMQLTRDLSVKKTNKQKNQKQKKQQLNKKNITRPEKKFKKRRYTDEKMFNICDY